MIAAAFFPLAASGAQAATLQGDTVSCGIVSTGPWSCSTSTALVGMGSEFTLQFFGNDLFSVDIAASSIRLDFVSGSLGAGAGELLTFSDLDFTPASNIVGIGNFQTTALFGVQASDVSFTADSVSFDFNGTDWRNGQFVSFDLVTAQTGVVPLPAGLPLLLAGLGGLGLLARRKRKAA
ncbi:VPLPA-CTERM sorting domain-containing protein [Roseovarius aestuariivivens]|uniref:VPLPA-CTERM sorting domain-containing protein n=1 Tax=Roseovarius aestuariivivens TaxID=1888910 RepID=UPI001FDA19A4|nr:VPLPA-CTERM sorting domain-containing protein [Roseovarius aestuariivivens]